MATVPELKAEAKLLGIVGYSAMRKPELIKAIAAKRAQIEETVNEALSRSTESDSDMIDNATPSATPARTLTRAERAAQAGSRGKHATPVPNELREIMYRWQNARNGRQTVLTDKPLTPAQSRRMRKKGNKLSGFNGCTLTDYREMRRRMKRAGMIPAGQH